MRSRFGRGFGLLIMVSCLSGGGSSSALSATLTVNSLQPNGQYAVAWGGLTTSSTSPHCTYLGNSCSTIASVGLSVPQFDPVLGTLTQADVLFSYASGMGVEVFNGNSTYVSFTLGVTANNTTNTLSGPAVSLSQSLVTYSLSSGVSLLGYHATTLLSNSFSSGSTSTSILAAALLANYIGTGNVSFTAGQNGNVTPRGTSASAGFNGAAFTGMPANVVSYAFLRSFAPKVTVTYHYDEPSAVPLPPAFLLAGTGLVGAVIANRRRRKKTPATAA